MRQPQVVNLNEDGVLAFSAEDVIDDTTQVKMSGAVSPLLVSIYFTDLGDGTVQSVVGVDMRVVNPAPTWWVIDIADILAIASDALVDRHKYVAAVYPATESNMRPFNVLEFSIDNDGFEDTWMRLPYQVEINPVDDPTKSYLRWYDNVANFGEIDHCKYWAYAYMNGTLTTYADRADRVTHRGPITAYVAP